MAAPVCCALHPTFQLDEPRSSEQWNRFNSWLDEHGMDRIPEGEFDELVRMANQVEPFYRWNPGLNRFALVSSKQS